MTALWGVIVVTLVLEVAVVYGDSCDIYNPNG